MKTSILLNLMLFFCFMVSCLDYCPQNPNDFMTDKHLYSLVEYAHENNDAFKNLWSDLPVNIRLVQKNILYLLGGRDFNDVNDVIDRTLTFC